MTTTADDLREEVRRRYGESARAVIEGDRRLWLRERLVLLEADADAEHELR